MADQTVTELIKLALRKCGAVASGETPTADEMSEALIALRVMLRQWSSRSLMLFKVTTVSHALDGSQSYTIGSGADISATRPVRIVNAYVRSGGIDYPVDVVGSGKYAAISDKSDGSTIPLRLWYNPGYSQGIIYIHPTGTGSTLYMDTLIPLTDPTTLTEEVVFPGEYDSAIVWNLACDMCPEYGREPTPYMLGRAIESKDDVVAINCALSMEEADLGVDKIGQLDTTDSNLTRG